jgi:hypothetical protein
VIDFRISILFFIIITVFITMHFCGCDLVEDDAVYGRRCERSDSVVPDDERIRIAHGFGRQV